MFGWLKKLLKSQRVNVDTDARVAMPKFTGLGAPKPDNPQTKAQTAYKPPTQTEVKPQPPGPGHYELRNGVYVWIPHETQPKASLPIENKNQTPTPAVNKPVLPETSARERTFVSARQPRMSRGVRITAKTPRLSK